MNSDNSSSTPMADSFAPSVQQINQQSLTDRLNGYKAAMAPGVPVSNEEGAVQQLKLWRAIQMVLGRSGSEFIALYTQLLNAIKEGRQTVFSERYVFRFMAIVKMNVNERRNFERIVRLMLVTCDPSVRTVAMKHVDLKNVLIDFDENVKQNMAGFYRL